MPVCFDNIQADTIFTFVDVGYYTDMNEWARYGRPMFIYSQTVREVAGPAPDGVYSIVKGVYRDAAGRASHSGTILQNHVNGGAVYEHPLWDWAIDHFSVRDWWGNLITFLVERRRCPSGRFIIACFPTAAVAWPYWSVPPKPLQRLDLLVGDVAVNEFVEDEAVKISITRPGLWKAFSCTPTIFAGWGAKFDNVVGKPLVGDVERYMRASNIAGDVATEWAPIVFDLLKSKWRPRGVPKMSCADVIVSGVQPLRSFVSATKADERFPVYEALS